MNRERQGEILTLLGAVIWGFFPIITTLSYRASPPLVSLGVSTLIGAAFFGAVLSVRGTWRSVFDPTILPDVLGAAFFSGFLFYVLTFLALTKTSAGNVGIIALVEVLSSFLFFNAWRKERIPREHAWGAVLMVAGALIVLYPNHTSFNIGDMFVLIAAAIAPFGNFFQRRARTRVAGEVLLFGRSVLAGCAALACSFLFDPPMPPGALARSFPFLLANGLLMFGITKLLWVEIIHRISIMKANALSSVSPLVTLAGAAVLLGTGPTVWQIASLVPMVLGVYLLGKNGDIIRP